ncbi:MAG: nucleotidyltransferase domain-containing protein [Kofleriaceae bacterium]|nr:nucleotidyltransferase domain-containing protein [Kofleriaceae bacterium]
MTAFATAVRARFGSRVHAILVFGSRARGDARPDSDVDVAVVVDGLTGGEGREIAQLAGDGLTDHDVLISAFAISTARMEELTARGRLIALDIACDGISV